MLLDSELQLIDSADAPRGASSLALLNDGRSALVGGTLSDTLRLFSLSGQGLLKEADYQIPGLTSTADLAVDGGELFLTDAFERGILHTPVPASSAELAFEPLWFSLPSPPGRIRVTRNWLAVTLPAEGRILLVPRDHARPDLESAPIHLEAGSVLGIRLGRGE